MTQNNNEHRQNPYPLLTDNEKWLLCGFLLTGIYSAFLIIFLNFCQLCAIIMVIITVTVILGFGLYGLIICSCERYKKHRDWELNNRV